MATTRSPLVSAAERTAHRMLRDDPVRLAHSAGAAHVAEHVSTTLDASARETVIASAWLHDIGYAAALTRTGFHSLDGALHLARTNWPDEVVRLVAHHSHAIVLAPYFGVDHHLAVLEPVPGRLPDIVTFADIVSGTDGTGTTVKRRIDEMRIRHSTHDSPVPTDVREARYALLERTALGVLRSLPSAGVELASIRT